MRFVHEAMPKAVLVSTAKLGAFQAQRGAHELKVAAIDALKKAEKAHMEAAEAEASAAASLAAAGCLQAAADSAVVDDETG